MSFYYYFPGEGDGVKRDTTEGSEHLARERFSLREEKGTERRCWGTIEKSPSDGFSMNYYL